MPRLKRLPRSDLTPYATRNCIGHAIAISPLIDHFLREKAALYGISVAELWRRFALVSIENEIRYGTYSVPACLRTAKKVPVRTPQPRFVKMNPYFPAIPPEAVSPVPTEPSPRRGDRIPLTGDLDGAEVVAESDE